MFTGIVTDIGKLEKIEKKKVSTLSLSADIKKYNLQIGDSVAVNGICLTVIKIKGNIYSFNLADETIKLSNLSDSSFNNPLNLEMPLKLGDFLGGHLVSGHIDGTVRLKTKRKRSNSTLFTFRYSNKEWRNFMVFKGSVTLNGISLTIAEMTGYTFKVAVILHTLQSTNLKYAKINDRINIEFDLIGKYLYNQGLFNKD